MFQLPPAFPATSEALGDLALCHARLQADARYAWIVLLPRVADARELEDLNADQRGRPVGKLTVAQLGNVTPQLHIHVIGRRPDDAAWPGPVWGHGAAQAYAAEALETALKAARNALGLLDAPRQGELSRRD